MTDDAWRRGREDNDDDFGPPLFADDPTGEVHARDGADDLSFGSHDTGPLPHWTQPPTGEVPRVLSSGASTGSEDELDVWSSFTGQPPAWSDDAPVASTRAYDEVPYDTSLDDTGVDESAPVRRQPGRITIGTDPTDGAPRPSAARRSRPGETPRGARPTRAGAPPRPGARPAAGGGRDLPTAVFVGLVIAAVFIGALLWRPLAVLAIIVAVLGLGAVEFFEKVTEKGYRPATVTGLAAAVALPIATYWVGESALPLVLVLAFGAGCVTFIGGQSLDSGPMPNMAITTLGVMWIGVMGTFAALIVRLSTLGGGNDIGTDTLCLLAIGVVANDVGAYFVGSAAGRTPLRHWISPNKSVEGFIGGTVATVLAMVIVSATDRSTTWNSAGDLILLAIVIAIAAPIGDLTESMFKRNLDVKDFGTLVKGHGGVLDRFDGFLFALPAVYYLLRVLEPWVTK
jgi:phosphatidate cytidylyltransferase